MCHLHLLSRTLVPLLCCMWTVAATGQTIYRCGNTYSQTPCGDGHTLTIDDSRTAQQKSQTDAATAETRKLAVQLERERVAQEKAAMVGVQRQDAGRWKDKHKETGPRAAQSSPAGAKNKPRATPNKSGTLLEVFAAPVTVDKKAPASAGAAKGR
jgi:hypothetical protein